jgi:hypothetical protein
MNLATSTLLPARNVDFDASIQSMAALDATIYRLIGAATCQVDRIAGRYVCRLTPCAGASKRKALSVADLKERFLNLVADENMRASCACATRGVSPTSLSARVSASGEDRHP